MNSGTAVGAESRFRAKLVETPNVNVLEMGTLRWDASRATHHKDWAPHANKYVMTDVEAGIDVDVVADAHLLSTQVPGMYDAIIAVSVWEHLARPWVAAQELVNKLVPGGIAYVCTHQTFPLHGYPHDYFRFSDKALSLIFEDAGMVTVEAGYQFPCKIVQPAEVTVWNDAAESYLNVGWYGYKAI